MNRTYYSIIYKSYDSNGKVSGTIVENYANLKIAKLMFKAYKLKNCSAKLVKIQQSPLEETPTMILELTVDYKYND